MDMGGVVQRFGGFVGRGSRGILVFYSEIHFSSLAVTPTSGMPNPRLFCANQKEWYDYL